MNTDELVLTASITPRKLKNGFKVRVHVVCNKFTTGSRVYNFKTNFVGDIDHEVARLITNLVSDIEDLNLHTAIRALEVTHSAYKNIVWNLLKGLKYGVSTHNKTDYYNSSVYSLITIHPLIRKRD